LERSDVREAINSFCRSVHLNPRNKTARENLNAIIASDSLTADQMSEALLLADHLDYLESLHGRIDDLVFKRDSLRDRLIEKGFDLRTIFLDLSDIKEKMFPLQKVFLYHDKLPSDFDSSLAYVSHILENEKERLIGRVSYLQGQYHWLKRISEDGREMVLIWSDAMKNAEGRSHTVNYRWNQMRVTIQLGS